MRAKKTTKEELVEFHTEEDRIRYLHKLKENYEKQKTTVFQDTGAIIKDMNFGEDHEPHPLLGSAEVTFGGVSLLLQLMNAEMTLIQLPFLVGAALVAAAGANNLDGESTYRGPFISIISGIVSPIIFTTVGVAKILDKIHYKKALKEAKTCKLVPVTEEQLELDKEQFSKDIQESIDSLEQSASQDLESVINEIKDLEILILDINSPTEAEQYIQELTALVEGLFDYYKKGFIKSEDMLKEFQKESWNLRNKAELTKLDEYMSDTSLPAFKNPLFLQLSQKHLERQKEAN